MGPEESVKGYKQFIFQYYDGKCLKRPGTGEPQNIFYPCIHFRALKCLYTFSDFYKKNLLKPSSHSMVYQFPVLNN